VVEPEPQPVYAPVISSFTANPNYIQPGQSAQLTWTVTNATSIDISPNVGSVPASGVYTVMPTYTTTYTMTASGSGGSVTASTTVTVAQPYPTYNTSSSTPPASTTPSVNTSGIGGGGSPALNLWLLYALLIGLLAAAAGVIITLLVRKPTGAKAGSPPGTRAGYLASATAPAATLPAAGAAHTTPLASGPSAKFTLDNGTEIALPAGGGAIGRNDLRSYAQPDKADLISRRHMTISYQGSDCTIEDNGSTNGTKLNGSDIRGKGKQVIKAGDEVDIAGALTIKFKD
jgi:hypothetical protein